MGVNQSRPQPSSVSTTPTKNLFQNQMCCNSSSAAASGNDATTTSVTETPVASPLIDGYWLNTFPKKVDAEYPDLVGYGLGFSGKPASIQLFLNPKNGSPNETRWKVTEIQRLDFPVAMTFADLTGNGLNDIIISDRYGPSMNELWDGKTDDGGRIQWLRNPGVDGPQPMWEAKKIGNSTGMHRLQVGHFTTKKHIQIMAFPIIPKSGDLESPAPVLLFTPKYGDDQSKGPESWTEETIFPDQFRLIHDIKVLPGIEGVSGGHDTVLVAGREGIVYLYHKDGEWKHNVIGTGLDQQPGNPYWGSGSVDVGRVHDDSVGYIATCEAFHGNVVSVYVKNENAPKGPESLLDKKHWKRVVLKEFGPLNKEHTGTIHHVMCGNLDGTPVDSFTVACMGAPVGVVENQGVYVFKPIDHHKGEFTSIKVTDESAGRVAIAAFTIPGVQEIASLSYYVPGYHVGPDPPNIRINRIDRPYTRSSNTAIQATKLNKEVLLRVPRPQNVPEGVLPQMSLLAFAGKKISLVVLPPKHVAQLSKKDGFKIIAGEVTMCNGDKRVKRGVIVNAKEVHTTIVESDDGKITAGDNGAVLIHIEYIEGTFQGPYREMSELVPVNLFPPPPAVPPEVSIMEFPFIKVQDLPWASSGLWNDFEFYNMTGFYIYYNDDAMDRICHMQAWTLGLGETARFHNHSDKSFCEIHSCISNGGGCGGMRFFPDDYTDPIDTDAELTKAYVEDNSKLIVCPSMSEHGPLWKIQEGSVARPVIRENDTADYPWHAWLASEFGDHELPIVPPLKPENQKYDVWLAFEFPTSTFQY